MTAQDTTTVNVSVLAEHVLVLRHQAGKILDEWIYEKSYSKDTLRMTFDRICYVWVHGEYLEVLRMTSYHQD